MAGPVQRDGEFDLAPLQEILERDFQYANHNDAEELILGALHATQGLYGWIPQPAAQLIADHLGVSINRVYGLMTFYADFRSEPPGRHTALLCHGAACYVMGSQRLIDHLQEHYRIGDHDVTEDGELSLQIVNACLGVCDLAPVVLFDHKNYCGRLDPATLDATIEALKRGESLEDRDGTD